MKRILIAGIGNIFFGDDAFGCEVATELARRQLPDGLKVVDFGIRSYDLAYAIMDGYDATILVDAVPRGEPAGTIYLMEIDIKKLDETGGESVNAHSMNPVQVLGLVRSLGGDAGRLYLVGCEPAVLETDEMGLSETVRTAVPHAIQMIEALVADLLAGRAVTISNSMKTKARVRSD